MRLSRTKSSQPSPMLMASSLEPGSTRLSCRGHSRSASIEVTNATSRMPGQPHLAVKDLGISCGKKTQQRDHQDASGQEGSERKWEKLEQISYQAMKICRRQDVRGEVISAAIVEFFDHKVAGGVINLC